jgi:glucuronoarabinoxylan endo-1,4-beta-xylanase
MKKVFAIAFAMVLWGTSVLAASVKFEAESGALGQDFAVSNGVPVYITITTDLAGNNPSNAARVATFSVTFPAAGAYDLYARIRVGAGGGGDDSMFYGNGFGTKDPTVNADWILINNLAGVGFTTATNIVTGGGTAGSGVWKWINLSEFASGPSFTVSSGSLTQTFQIGGRENGLGVDAFVFGSRDYTFTVAQLDAGADGTPPPPPQCTANWSDVRQRIDGFGGGVQFLNPGSLDPVPNSVMDTLYGTNANQLALTLLRIGIAPNGNWNNQMLDAQKAVARGAGVLATPWSPPASMKDNGSTIGGSLLPAQYTNYANYLNNYAAFMAANAAPLRAISVQNEPDFDATYDSCLWTPEQFQTFFHDVAGLITNAPVMMPESLRFDPAMSDPTLNDPVAAANVDLVGGHLYGVSTVQDYPNAHNKGKPTWMTEYLLNDQTIESAVTTAKQIHDCLTTGNMSAYIWWKAYGDANGVVNASGVPQRRGFVMSQWSAFVRPNDYRIGTVNTAGGFVSAFRNTNSGRFAIVAINTNSTPMDQTIVLQNFPGSGAMTPWITSSNLSRAAQSAVVASNSTFTYTLPAASVVTFVGNAMANTAPALTPVGNRTINAGVTLVLTNVATDTDVPAQMLTFSLLNNPPANAVLNATNGIFTWRPAVSQADTTNQFTVKVSDNGAPSLSATNTFNVTVNPLAQPLFSSITLVAGALNFTVSGDTGPDYTVQTSTNLMDWQVLFTTNSPVLPFGVTVTNLSGALRVYRVRLGP